MILNAKKRINFSVCMGAFCAGTVLSWSSPALGHLERPKNASLNFTNEKLVDLPPPGFKIDESDHPWIGSLLTIGALVSAIPIGYLADKFGRKKVILSLSFPFIINWILMIFAQNVKMIFAARFFAGIGLGGVCVTAPMYIGEIAEAAYRGMFGSFFQMFLCAGILFSSVVGSFTNWTGLNAIELISPIIFGVSFLFMPETPVFLVGANDIQAAEENLRKLRGSTSNVSQELKEIQQEIEESHQKRASLKDVVTSKGNLKAVISVVVILAYQQLTGINALVFFTDPIFKAAESPISSSVGSIIINLVQLIVAYISIMIVERANRKFYLMFSSTGLFLCLLTLGIFFHLKMLNLPLHNLHVMMIISFVLFMIFFSVGYGPVPWMLMGELLSPEIKGVASGLGVLSNWIFASVVTFCFPLMTASFGYHVTFYIFAGIMASATVFVYTVVPETRGKTLTEIQEILNR